MRTNSLGKAWLEKQGVTVAADGTIAPNATGATLALKLLREQFLTPESRKRSAFEAMNYYAGLGITTHLRLWADGERWCEFNTGQTGLQTASTAERIAAATVLTGAAQPAAT